MRTKPGQPYSESLVEQDIKALYRTGQVQNVRIFGQAEPWHIAIIFGLLSWPFVSRIVRGSFLQLRELRFAFRVDHRRRERF